MPEPTNAELIAGLSQHDPETVQQSFASEIQTMAPPRAGLTPADLIGNDGLTDSERAGYATAYERALRPVDAAERQAIKAWRDTRATGSEESTSQ